MLSSDPIFFPLQRPVNLSATQPTPNSLTHLVIIPYPNLRNNSDTPPLNLHQSLPARIPVSSVNIFPRPPTPFFSYPSSGLPTAHISKSTRSQKAQPQISTFKPQAPPKPTQIKPYLIVHSNTPAIPIIRPQLSVRTSLATLISQPLPITLYPTLSNLFP